jgi:hypothetical protein
MADPTDAELLTAARTALQTALTTGRSVTFGDRTFTSHDIADLQAIVARLTATVASAVSRKFGTHPK